MNLLLFAIIALCLIAIAVVYFFRPYDYGAQVQQFDRIANPDSGSDPTADTKWRSVRIRPGLNCCKLALSLQEQVFLSKEVPTLPLEYCTEKNCTCHYLFLDDRRSGLDRRAELARVGALLSGIDRRRSQGRRLADLAI